MIFQNVKYDDLDVAMDIYCECFSKKNVYQDYSNQLFGLYLENTLIGIVQIDFIHLVFENIKIAYINSLCIKKEFQHKGYGSILLQNCISFAKEQHANIIQLTSNPNRIIANKLYKNLGFTKVDTNFYRMTL